MRKPMLAVLSRSIHEGWGRDIAGRPRGSAFRSPARWGGFVGMFTE